MSWGEAGQLPGTLVDDDERALAAWLVMLVMLKSAAPVVVVGPW